MNWINRIKPGIKKLLKKRPFPKKDNRESEFVSCCSSGPILRSELANSLWVCPHCNEHHIITPSQRFDILFGKNNWSSLDTPIPDNEDPLSWQDIKPYKEKLIEAKKKTGLKCALLVAKGNLDGINITAVASDWSFMGSSISIAEGEAIIAACQDCIDNKNCLVIFPCGGGQRMYTSTFALVQMTRTITAIREVKIKNLPYIICYTGNVYGGITASFGSPSLGDITISEIGAKIGFAGPKIIQEQLKETLPSSFQTAERMLECGFLDACVNRKDVKNTISILLKILLKKHEVQSLDDTGEIKEDLRSSEKLVS